MIQNPDKHQALVLGNANYETKLTCANKSILIANEMKLLAVTLDNKLKFNSHVATISHKVGGQVNALNQLKNILPCRTKEVLYHAYILPHFNYCRFARFGTTVKCKIPEKLRGLTSAPCDMYTRTVKHHMKSCSSGSD